MSKLSNVEIYQAALQAGFTPEQAVTFTAIALAESGGDPRAHATGIEDSRGLWQINVDPDVRPNKWGDQLYDPVVNARAAYEISGGGRNIGPWSVTHERHRGTQRDYRTYLDEARVAATTVDTDGRGGSEVFVESALAQTGDRYVFGAETTIGDLNPSTFDCSELVQWAAGQAGVQLTDGSWRQYLQLQEQGGAISVEEALHTRGALLFYFSSAPTHAGRPDQAHVAISLGDGRTVEAMDPAHGVVTASAGDRFNYAAVIPALATSTPNGPSGTEGAAGLLAGASPYDMPEPPPIDTDSDGLTDEFELLLGTDPGKADTDDDGLSDMFETSRSHTDPLKADTDSDHVPDSIEVAEGTDAGRVPLPEAAVERGFGGAGTYDSDADGLSDLYELRTGTDLYAVDSDHDGIGDALERAMRSDPLTIDTNDDGIVDAVEAAAGTLGRGLPPGPDAAGLRPPETDTALNDLPEVP